jgi:hypothetical protein
VKSRYALALVVVGILIVLRIFLIIAMNLGHKTGNDTDDPNGTHGNALHGVELNDDWSRRHFVSRAVGQTRKLRGPGHGQFVQEPSR